MPRSPGASLEKYEIDRAIRPFAEFIDDLSTWYIRRSRDRFKSENAADRTQALATTRRVLLDLSKLLAPFMPFLAEDIYKHVKGGKESVHLEEWPEFKKADAKILTDMKEVRRVASLGLEARMKAKINVRQPLAKLSVKSAVSENLVDIIKDEVNVKEVVMDTALAEEVVLDTTLTPELKEEGTIRELIRAIQDLRKEKGLTIQDRAILTIETDPKAQELIAKNKEILSSTTLLKEVKFGNVEGEAKMVGELSLKIGVSK